MTEAERLRAADRQPAPGLGAARSAARRRGGAALQPARRAWRRGLLEQFGLAERRRSAFASLSGGERQRLFLVLALVGRPRLVILDELTQGLDPAARRNVWAAVSQLREPEARPSSWSPTSSTRPSTSATGWWRCARDGSSTRVRRPSWSIVTARRATIRFGLEDVAMPMLCSSELREVRRGGSGRTTTGDAPRSTETAAPSPTSARRSCATARYPPTSASTSRPSRMPSLGLLDGAEAHEPTSE